MKVPPCFLGMRSQVSIRQIPFMHFKEGRKNKRSETGTYSAVHFLLMEDSRCCCCCWVAPVVSDSVDPRDGSPPGSAIPGILQARTLEWVAISFSDAWKWKVKVKSLSRAWLLATPWTAAYQAPPSVGFSRQEYWNGLPLPSPKMIIYDNHVEFIWNIDYVNSKIN